MCRRATHTPRKTAQSQDSHGANGHDALPTIILTSYYIMNAYYGQQAGLPSDWEHTLQKGDIMTWSDEEGTESGAYTGKWQFVEDITCYMAKERDGGLRWIPWNLVIDVEPQETWPRAETNRRLARTRWWQHGHDPYFETSHEVYLEMAAMDEGSATSSDTSEEDL
jgi:hypothetical protein